MLITGSHLKYLINEELETITNEQVRDYIYSLLIEPTPTLRGWDYGQPDEKYVCWGVLNHDRSNTGIAYCEDGFGPISPWGLVFHTEESGMSMGMDSGWYRTFLSAFFESFAATDLPIWRVFKTDNQNIRIPISA